MWKLRSIGAKRLAAGHIAGSRESHGWGTGLAVQPSSRLFLFSLVHVPVLDRDTKKPLAFSPTLNHWLTPLSFFKMHFPALYFG